MLYIFLFSKKVAGKTRWIEAFLLLWVISCIVISSVLLITNMLIKTFAFGAAFLTSAIAAVVIAALITSDYLLNKDIDEYLAKWRKTKEKGFFRLLAQYGIAAIIVIGIYFIAMPVTEIYQEKGILNIMLWAVYVFGMFAALCCIDWRASIIAEQQISKRMKTE